jgi:hypothetical protein
MIARTVQSFKDKIIKLIDTRAIAITAIRYNSRSLVNTIDIPKNLKLEFLISGVPVFLDDFF